MAATAPAQAAPKTQAQRYEFVEDVWVDEDDTKGNRVLANKGTAFTAEMAEELVIDRRGREPKEVATGQMYVQKADLPISPGCLTSCIRTGRAKTPAQIRIDAENEAERKKAAKK